MAIQQGRLVLAACFGARNQIDQRAEANEDTAMGLADLDGLL
jgi:hypothetical protein